MVSLYTKQEGFSGSIPQPIPVTIGSRQAEESYQSVRNRGKMTISLF